LISGAILLACLLAIPPIGPAGGTFQIFASAIQTYGVVKESTDYRIKAQSSAGSIENLRKVDRGKIAVRRNSLRAPVSGAHRQIEERREKLRRRAGGGQLPHTGRSPRSYAGIPASPA